MSIKSIKDKIRNIADGGRNTASEIREVLTDMTESLSGGTATFSGTTDDVNEGSNNLYYTDERVNSLISGITSNTDNFLTGTTFNTSTGDLELNLKSGSTITTNLDDRYSLTGHTHTEYVDTTGTTLANQLSIFSDEKTITGDPALSWSGASNTLLVSGSVKTNNLTFISGETINWNPDFHTINIPTGLGPVVQVGQEFVFLVENNTGVDIADGKVVTVDGLNAVPNITLARADVYSNCDGSLLVTTMPIPDGEQGFASLIGRVSDIDIGGIPQGQPLYISATEWGGVTNIKPTFPHYVIPLGSVVSVSGGLATISVNFTGTIDDTFNNFWNGTIRESFDVFTTVTGSTIELNLASSNGEPDLTMIFSDGFATLTATPPATVVLTAGTNSVPQMNYVYIPQDTKLLTVSLTGFTETEHIAIAKLYIQTAVKTADEGPLILQSLNDHIQNTTSNQGHLSHISKRLRQESAKWNLGVSATNDVTSESNLISTTSGSVYQLHKHYFPAFDMSTGSHVHITNDFITPFKEVFNLSGETVDSLGNSMDGSAFSFVLWGSISDEGNSRLFINLPNGTYNKNAPDLAVQDAQSKSNYSIPVEFNGSGFLIARFTYVLNTGNLWSLYNSEDLRGNVPGSSGGSGGSELPVDVTTGHLLVADGAKWNSVLMAGDASIGADGTVIVNAGSSDSIFLTGKVNEVGGITKGRVLYFSGATGGLPQVSIADNTDFVKSDTIAIAAETKSNGQNITVITTGLLENMDTSGFIEGAALYLSTGGTMTNTHPSGVDAVQRVGKAVKINASTGSMYVNIDELTVINNHQGTVRHQVVNENPNIFASAGYTVVNDERHRASFNILGSGWGAGNEHLGIYNEGYGKTIFTVDGNYDFEWYTDATDAHNFASTVKMTLSAAGDLLLSSGSTTAQSFITSGGTSADFVKGDGTLDSNAYSLTGHTHTESDITDLQDYALNSDVTSHTGDTSIHFTKNSINLDDLGATGHTHNLSELNDDVGYLTGATNTIDFNTHTGDTSIHFTKGSISLDDLGATGHTHSESDITDLQDYALNSNLDSHSGDTSIHFEMSAITITESQISDLQDYSVTGHNHDISEITGFTDNSTNWDTAYNDSITGMTVTGSATKTITLQQKDGSTLTANFTDSTGGGGSGDVVTGMTFNTLNGDLEFLRHILAIQMIVLQL
jgi:hypothetical protein